MITTLIAAALAAATPAAPAAPVDHSQHTPAQHAQHQHAQHQKGEGEHKCCKEVNGKMECRMMKGHGADHQAQDGHGQQQQH
jgi:hypothetical protein